MTDIEVLLITIFSKFEPIVGVMGIDLSDLTE
jgi:hypothetical protein